MVNAPQFIKATLVSMNFNRKRRQAWFGMKNFALFALKKTTKFHFLFWIFNPFLNITSSGAFNPAIML
jgi:hypothetical protein